MSRDSRGGSAPKTNTWRVWIAVRYIYLWNSMNVYYVLYASATRNNSEGPYANGSHNVNNILLYTVNFNSLKLFIGIPVLGWKSHWLTGQPRTLWIWFSSRNHFITFWECSVLVHNATAVPEALPLHYRTRRSLMITWQIKFAKDYFRWLPCIKKTKQNTPIETFTYTWVLLSTL